MTKKFIPSFKEFPWDYGKIYNTFDFNTILKSCKNNELNIVKAHCVIFCWKLLQYESSIGYLPREIMLIIAELLAKIDD